MKSYQIEAATGGLSITYTVRPQEDGQFKIMKDKDQLGLIYPEVTKDGTTWHTDDDIDDLLLNAIGQAIEAQEGI